MHTKVERKHGRGRGSERETDQKATHIGRERAYRLNILNNDNDDIINLEEVKYLAFLWSGLCFDVHHRILTTEKGT